MVFPENYDAHFEQGGSHTLSCNGVDWFSVESQCNRPLTRRFVQCPEAQSALRQMAAVVR